MSGSEYRTVEVEAVSTVQPPDEGLALALEGAFAQLVQQGAGPPHLVSMQWSGPDPAALHPSRRIIDQRWRMAFAGFRPPLQIALSNDAAIHVRAIAHVPLASPPATPVFRDYGVTELAREMNPRNQVPDMGVEFRQWTADGAKARAGHAGLDLVYGPHPAQILDLYRPRGVTRPPLWVFMHGGYWQASNKDQHAHWCVGMLKAGFAVANVDYGLAPETPLEGIVAHIRDALHFLVREADKLAFDADSIHVAGHSAGGYLAARCASDADMPAIRSAHLLSGIFDLESLLPLPFAPILGLISREQARRLSPIRVSPRTGVKIGVALGGLESNEFKRQSAEIAQAWNAGPSLVVEGFHHFNLLDGLNGGALLEQQLRLTAV